MSMIKIVGACVCLLICAIWAGVMWVGTWDTEEERRKAESKEILKKIFEELRGEE